MGTPNEVTTRRVVTGHDDAGRDLVAHDERLSVPTNEGVRRLELWRISAPPSSPHAGGSPSGDEPAFARPGEVAWRLFVLPPDDRPLHRTDSVDLLQVLDGEVTVVLEQGEARLARGDCLVMRGEQHGWRNDTDRAAVLAAVMLGAPAGAGQDRGPVATAEAPSGAVPRRVVTGLDGAGRSCVVADGEPPCQLVIPDRDFAMVDLWQTKGPLEHLDQGGDLEPGAIELMPAGGGISWRQLTLPPDESPPPRTRSATTAPEPPAPDQGGAEHDPEHPALHRTDTVDFILVLDGEVTLAVPDQEPRQLHAGDTVVQRGTWHAWNNHTDRPCTFSAVMVTTPPLVRPPR